MIGPEAFRTTSAFRPQLSYEEEDDHQNFNQNYAHWQTLDTQEQPFEVAKQEEFFPGFEEGDSYLRKCRALRQCF